MKDYSVVHSDFNKVIYLIWEMRKEAVQEEIRLHNLNEVIKHIDLQ